VEQIESDKLADTNGPGDAFVGGFLFKLMQEKSMEEYTMHWAAKYIILQSGTPDDYHA
jgi:sugar/nucleoside kinase (ribokinase family)